MRLTKIRIRNFRSIEDLTLEVGELAVFCGPNSCGKSNVFRALQFAFRTDAALSREEIYRNMSASKRDTQGAPKLSIYIDLTFEGCPASVCAAAGVGEAEVVEYNFRAIRNGSITRKLGATRSESGSGEDLLEVLRACFVVQYVPPIRDLAAGGMEPFRQLLAEALKRSRKGASMTGPQNDARRVLRGRGDALLADHMPFVKGTLRAEGLHINTEAVSLETLYELVTLDVDLNGHSIPLQELGTGHQSAVIIHLFRQLGQVTEGDTLFLFEEPDNHLHPATIRAIGDDLRKLSETESAQVFVTTHSPVLIGHFGFDDLHPLHLNPERMTECQPVDMTGLSDSQLRALLHKYGLRVTEPLLARRIVVCEGPSDVVVLSRLIERRYRVTPDQLDLVMVAAGGAANVVEVAHFLDRLGAQWRAVLDWDSIYDRDPPQTIEALPEPDRQAADRGIDALVAALEPDKRNDRLIKTLRKLRRELTGGRSEPKLYHGSRLEDLLEAKQARARLAKTEQGALIDGLNRKRRREYSEILGRYNVWLWQSDLEHEMTSSSKEAADVVELELQNAGVITGPVTPKSERVDRLCRILHNRAEDPILLQRIVDQLDEEKCFNRTQINMAVRFLVDGLV
jgi:energy-coupling factor transporter ATP-binding protein EcfA2